MSRSHENPTYIQLTQDKKTHTNSELLNEQVCCELLGINSNDISTLPFSADDITAGSETELQVAVMGDKNHVDLPCTIRNSSYYANIVRRSKTGDVPDTALEQLDEYLNNESNVWENSWVRFPLEKLNTNSLKIFNYDLKADKKSEENLQRSDSSNFLFMEDDQPWVRVPISYLVRLSLADILAEKYELPEYIRSEGMKLVDNFSNDNTSPETHSFTVLNLDKQKGLGFQLSRETSHRFLFTHLLTEYANKHFGLEHFQQKALIFFSPHPPSRQKQLNDCISDNFYRALFMSPCLSGWDKGEEKHAYMALCHQVLSRSHLNAVAKLRDAGIINSNLIILPNTSNISLANNGTHISLGSKKVQRAIEDKQNAFNEAHEKLLGDLVIKITEHFLPLFVGTYTAAPYRIDFEQFHPETALGFLPHELDFTHLRMFWRRWKNKAKIKFIGRPITPFGPNLVDQTVSSSLGLKGDFVPDFRLIDYPAALLSTDENAALDGKLGNQDLLKEDLDKMGIFDKNMSMYLLFKLREFHKMGYCGFEGRHYSLFHSIEHDMGQAVNLQILIQALAYKLIAEGKVTHKDIPDSPEIESERRQIFFTAAVQLKKFSIKQDTQNQFLTTLLQSAKRIKKSRRNKGFNSVRLKDYREALVNFIKTEGEELITSLGLEETVTDLERRLNSDFSVSDRLVSDILKEERHDNPIKLSGKRFNSKAEEYYRTDLRIKHLAEAMDSIFIQVKAMTTEHQTQLQQSLKIEIELTEWLFQTKQHLISEALNSDRIRKLVALIIFLDCDLSADSHTTEQSNDEQTKYQENVNAC
ncbi:hypothetical protein [Litoribrevibacter albus]|uniref:Uncharacterized protein n=1 Tax=Litoribrevibacter albus TaxID=1473156 RepID=A0AA37S7E1_9GAMM|nr:hypothetical protein [Litoribrevibacter albus]GLQ29885.1 hypothetical protein GCM10007876_03630 [Litoribrevibacter albus]